MNGIAFRPWVAVISAAFLLQVIVGGMMKSFGVLLITMTQQCEISVWKYGNTIALTEIIGSIVAVVASPLMKVVYPRYVLIVTGFMIGSGFMLAAIANNWTFISLALIFLTGIGFRTGKVFTLGTLAQYVDQHYLLAFSFVYVGTPIGTIIYAPLTQLFLDLFGWRSTFMLLGALAYNSVLCGVLIKPHSRQIAENSKEHNSKESNRHDNSNSISKCIDLVFFKISKWFDLALFKDFAFISLLVCDLCVSIGWQAWVLYLIPHGVEKGLSPYQSSGLAMVGGVGYIIGIMTPSVTVDTGFVTEYQARTIGLIISGVTFLIDPWINSFAGQIVLSVVCTTSMGVNCTLSTGIATKISVSNLAQVLSFSCLMAATGYYIGGFIPGLLFDVTGSYRASFLFIGVVEIIAAIFAGLTMVLEHRHSANQNKAI